MMGKKKLSEVKAQLAAMLNRLPEGWLANEIESAKDDPTRDVKALEMLSAALEGEAKNHRKPKALPLEGIELEKSLAKKLDALEREVKKRRKPKAHGPAKR
jgi:hypothetical protein